MKEILNKIKQDSELINNKEFDSIFDNAWNNMKSSFIKLEAEQYYQCDMDSNYDNYKDKDYDRFIKTLEEFSKDWPLSLKGKSNINMKRLHLINIPITEYLNYEMYFYLINEKAGEKIRCLNYSLDKLDDFIIFDADSIIINCHDANGKYLESYYYNKDKNLIKELIDKYNELFNKANKFYDYANFDSEIINRMKNNELI